MPTLPLRPIAITLVALAIAIAVRVAQHQDYQSTGYALGQLAGQLAIVLVVVLLVRLVRERRWRVTPTRRPYTAAAWAAGIGCVFSIVVGSGSGGGRTLDQQADAYLASNERCERAHGDPLERLRAPYTLRMAPDDYVRRTVDALPAATQRITRARAIYRDGTLFATVIAFAATDDDILAGLRDGARRQGVTPDAGRVADHDTLQYDARDGTTILAGAVDCETLMLDARTLDDARTVFTMLATPA
jgi:hypothetical protein